MNKKILCILVALFLVWLCLFFPACGNGGDSGADATLHTDVTDSPDEEANIPAENLTPYLPEMDYGGYEFKVLTDRDSIVVDEENGEVVNDAKYRRNRTIEAKYNIVIKNVVYVGDIHSNEIYSYIRKSNAAGEYIYDIAFPNMRDAGKLAVENQLVNIKDIPYIDLTKKWWTPSAVEQLSFAGKLYFTPADIHTGGIERCNVTLFNKNIVEKHELENLYNLVDSGQWTLEKLFGMCKTVTLDLDGDGKIQGFNDQYGITTWLSHGVYGAYLLGANEYIVKKNADDYPELVMNNQRFYDVYEKIRELTQDHNFVANGNASWLGHEGFDKLFPADKVLFLMEVMECAQRFREMQTNFGIIPFPKYNEAQEGYYTYTAWSASLFSVPISNGELERTGIISEALAAESSKTVMPAYIDVALGSKYLRDDESRPMVDLVLNTRVYDLAYIYQWGDIGNVVNNALIGNKKDIVSIYEKTEEKVKTAIEKSIEKINELD